MNTCKYWQEDSIFYCTAIKNCNNTDCVQHPKHRKVVALKNEVSNMQKHVGKTVCGEKNGMFISNYGRLVKVFIKSDKCVYQIKKTDGQIITCNSIKF